MTHFFLSLILVSFFALPQASASSEEELATCILKVPYGTSFRLPTKEELATLPTEKIDAPTASLLLVRWPHPRVKVAYEPTKEPLTLQKMCEGLRAGHVFTISYSMLAADVYNIFSYIPGGATDAGEPRESYFKVVTPGCSFENWGWRSASNIFQNTTQFIEWPYHACLRMKPVEGTPNTFIMPPSPSCTQGLGFLIRLGILPGESHSTDTHGTLKSERSAP